MAKLISLPLKSDDRGGLVIVDGVLPFEIKRAFTIFDVPEDATRGGHRHIETIQALVAVKGEVTIENDNGKDQSSFTLKGPSECLLLYPEDFHIMKGFSSDCVLQVYASTPYDSKDYIHEGY